MYCVTTADADEYSDEQYSQQYPKVLKQLLVRPPISSRCQSNILMFSFTHKQMHIVNIDDGQYIS